LLKEKELEIIYATKDKEYAVKLKIINATKEKELAVLKASFFVFVVVSLIIALAVIASAITVRDGFTGKVGDFSRVLNLVFKSPEFIFKVLGIGILSLLCIGSFLSLGWRFVAIKVLGRFVRIVVVNIRISDAT